jgi:hypothetical protein
MVFHDGHLYNCSEYQLHSDCYRFLPDLSNYFTTTGYITGSYGTFSNPGDLYSFWAVFDSTPGKIKKFDLFLNELWSLDTPSGTARPSEIVFDSSGNMYVSTFQSPARMMRFAPPDPVTVSIAKSGNDVVLSWAHSDALVDHYEVWTSADPYFLPNDPGSTKLADVTPVLSSGTYTHTAALGNASVHHFYVVRAVNSFGLTSAISNRVGEFEFDLLPGVIGTDNYSVIALPLDVLSQIADADQLATYIGSGVQQVLSWEPVSQSYEFWLPPFAFGTNFALQTGRAYWLLLDNSAASLVSFVGGVPAPGAISFSMLGDSAACLYNDFSLPLDEAAITTASQMSSSIGDIEQTLHWDAASQSFEFWLPDFGFGTDFPTNIGNPYHTCMRAPKNWP